VFRGRFEHQIDAKGRLSIPSKFREVLSKKYDETLIVTNFDGALWGYPVAEWQAIEEKVAALPQFKPAVKTMQRFFISAASECPVDPQGRILIPPSLREYAGLKRDVVLVGITRRIEIWARERWITAFGGYEKEIEEMGEALGELGL